MADEPQGAAAPIDVAALMADLRQRVARKKARGQYVTDVLARSLAAEEGGDAGPDPELLERLQGGAIVHQKLLVGTSTRPGVGPVIERAKGAVVRAGFANLADVTEQQNRFNADAARAIAALSAQVATLKRALRTANVAASGAVDTAAQDAAVIAHLATDRGPLRLIAVADRDQPDGDASSAPLGVLSAAIPDEPEDLERLASDLARATDPGTRVAVAPGARDAVAVAALLRASGFASAQVRPTAGRDEQPGGLATTRIVIAER